MSGILGTALSGLMAFQRSLETTSHNIANVNTEGYSRQRAELSTRPEQYIGQAGYLGQGVNVTNISRSYDQFITNQLNSSTSAFAETSEFYALASQVDNVIADPSTSLSPALKSFFNAVNEVANDPSSIPARQVMIGETENLAGQFNTLTSRFEELRSQTNKQMQANVDEINGYAEAFAELNVRIASGSNSSTGMPNDLLDQRDALIAKIAEKVNVSAVQQSDGSISLFIGSGQPLVLGASTQKLALADSATDPSHKEILANGQPITRQIAGGELYGLLKFRDQVLDPAQNQLGLLAAGLAVEFNAQHQAGYDLNTDPGQALFVLGGSALAVPVVANPNLPGGGAVSAVYDPANTGKLQASDYRLDYDGSNYTLTRLSDNQAVHTGALPADVDGMTLAETTAPAGVSSFLIRPTFSAAKMINANISDPRAIAAASAPATLPGDNTNALKLAQLERASSLLGGKATYSDAYGQLVSQVGTLTHAAKISRSAQEVLLNQATQARENLAGVNLDEEAANLIKFQNSYQAAAQAIAVANSLFDTLIGAVR